MAVAELAEEAFRELRPLALPASTHIILEPDVSVRIKKPLEKAMITRAPVPRTPRAVGRVLSGSKGIQKASTIKSKVHGQSARSNIDANISCCLAELSIKSPRVSNASPIMVFDDVMRLSSQLGKPKLDV